MLKSSRIAVGWVVFLFPIVSNSPVAAQAPNSGVYVANRTDRKIDFEIVRYVGLDGTSRTMNRHWTFEPGKQSFLGDESMKKFAAKQAIFLVSAGGKDCKYQIDTRDTDGDLNFTFTPACLESHTNLVTSRAGKIYVRNTIEQALEMRVDVLVDGDGVRHPMGTTWNIGSNSKGFLKLDGSNIAASFVHFSVRQPGATYSGWKTSPLALDADGDLLIVLESRMLAVGAIRNGRNLRLTADQDAVGRAIGKMLAAAIANGAGHANDDDSFLQFLGKAIVHSTRDELVLSALADAFPTSTTGDRKSIAHVVGKIFDGRLDPADLTVESVKAEIKSALRTEDPQMAEVIEVVEMLANLYRQFKSR